MSDAQDQIERVMSESEIPADGTQEEPLEADLAPDRTRQFANTSFSRMRSGWQGDDRDKVIELETLAGEIIKERFAEAFGLMEYIRRCVRTQAHDPYTGEFLAYPDGTPVWEKDELGVPVESWELLSDGTRRDLLLTLAAYDFEWGLTVSDMWADAMYAKGIWEEKFAQGFTALPPGLVTGKPTIDDRTQHGHKNAAQERYFALFRSALSRKADGLVRAMRGFQRVLENTQVR